MHISSMIPANARARAQANVADYSAECAQFSWEAAFRRLAFLPSGGINMGYEAIDRHVLEGRGDEVALRWLGGDGSRLEFTYRDFEARTNQVANALQKLGVESGDHVYTLLGRVPALYFMVLGALKAGAVVTPLFSSFGPEPVLTRLNRGKAKALLTSRRLYDRTVASIRERATDLEHVLITDDICGSEGLLQFDHLVEPSDTRFSIAPTDPEHPALLHFTSGTTGVPKGALHVHAAICAHRETARVALDLKPDDVFWCTADPGWVTGTSYGILAPRALGATVLVTEAEFDTTEWYRTLERERVTVWYTAPTAIRRLMRSGASEAQRFDLSALRFIASVGEPLNPEAVTWGVEAFGIPIHDNWWQTETGGIMIANLAACDVFPGSMGRPLPGITAAVLRRREDGEIARTGGEVEQISDPDEEGELALRAGWPSMFRSYVDNQERYDKCFRDDWYLTGDIVRRDRNGYYWFVARGDDVIKTSGHLVGPFEVESALLEHPAVAEAAVIGIPDPIAGNVVKAFVSLRDGYDPSDSMRQDLMAFARHRLGAVIAPRSIEFSNDIPKTRSGKVLRRLLRARTLGLPEGDLSTLEVSHP